MTLSLYSVSQLALNGLSSGLSQAPAIVEAALKDAWNSIESRVTRTVLEKYLVDLEKKLNSIGRVPFVSNLSGGIRVLLGKLQIISGLFSGVVVAVQNYPLHDLDNSLNKDIFDLPTTLVAHGAANIVRGMVESIPFAGNLAAFIYDENKLRFHYQEEMPKQQQQQGAPAPLHTES